MDINQNMPGQTLVIPNQMELVREENGSILARAKEPIDLIENYSFGIEEIVFSSSDINFTPNSEMRLGGRSSSYQGGNLLSTTIKTCWHPNIQEVYFQGWPNLQKRDVIRVHFFLGEKINLQSYRGVVPYPGGRNETTEYIGGEEKGPFVWHKIRSFSGKTAALKIEKLSSAASGEVLATYRDESLLAKYGLK